MVFRLSRPQVNIAQKYQLLEYRTKYQWLDEQLP